MRPALLHFVCFGDDSHRRDARRSHPCEDRRGRSDCALSLCCTVLSVSFQLENQNELTSVGNKTVPLAVMTIVGLHDFVKVSISAEFKSFILIICIDVPESTTTSRSSSLRFDAGRHLFPKVRRMLLFDAPLIITHFWQASTLLRGHLALATLSLPETDPQILERWGCADVVHLGKYIRAKDFCLDFECDVQ